jgi:hypothetical protein
MKRNLPPTESSSALVKTTISELKSEFARKRESAQFEKTKEMTSKENEWLESKRSAARVTVESSAGFSNDFMEFKYREPSPAVPVNNLPTRNPSTEFTASSSFADAFTSSIFDDTHDNHSRSTTWSSTNTAASTRKGGDWDCQNCSYVVFASKSMCPKCGYGKQSMSMKKPQAAHTSGFAVPSHFGGKSSKPLLVDAHIDRTTSNTPGNTASFPIGNLGAPAQGEQSYKHHSNNQNTVATSSTTTLTDEQRKRIEENKRLAQERLAATKAQREAEMGAFLATHSRYLG